MFSIVHALVHVRQLVAWPGNSEDHAVLEDVRGPAREILLAATPAAHVNSLNGRKRPVMQWHCNPSRAVRGQPSSAHHSPGAHLNA